MDFSEMLESVRKVSMESFWYNYIDNENMFEYSQIYSVFLRAAIAKKAKFYARTYNMEKVDDEKTVSAFSGKFTTLTDSADECAFMDDDTYIYLDDFSIYAFTFNKETAKFIEDNIVAELPEE